MTKSANANQLTFWSEEHLASLSPLPACEKEWQTLVATWPSSFWALLTAYAPGGLYGKTSPASQVPGPITRRGIHHRHSAAASRKLEELSTYTESRAGYCPAVETTLKRIRPRTFPASSPPYLNSGLGSPGEFWTLNTSEFPRDASASSLSDILETGDVPRRFFLTPKACAGILCRAEKRGRRLPPALLAALKAVAAADTPEGGGKTT